MTWLREERNIKEEERVQSWKITKEGVREQKGWKGVKEGGKGEKGGWEGRDRSKVGTG